MCDFLGGEEKMEEVCAEFSTLRDQDVYAAADEDGEATAEDILSRLGSVRCKELLSRVLKSVDDEELEVVPVTKKDRKCSASTLCVVAEGFARSSTS